MKQVILKTILMLGLAALHIGCSKVQPKDLASITDETNGIAGQSDTTDTANTTDVSDDMTNNNDSNNSGQSDDNDSSDDNDDTQVVDQPEGEGSDDTDVADQPESEGNDVVTDEEIIVVDQPSDEEQQQAALECLAQTNKELGSAANYTSLRGGGTIAGNLIVNITDIRGSYVISGTSSNSCSREINRTRGKLVICNMEVESLSDVRGSLILVNTTVKYLSNFRGNVKLINSTVLNADSH